MRPGELTDEFHDDVERVAEAVSLEYGQKLKERPYGEQMQFRRDALVSIRAYKEKV